MATTDDYFERMTTRRALKEAHHAAKLAQQALHAAYQADTSNGVVWDAFQSQVAITNKLHRAIIADIVKG